MNKWIQIPLVTCEEEIPLFISNDIGDKLEFVNHTLKEKPTYFSQNPIIYVSCNGEEYELSI